VLAHDADDLGRPAGELPGRRDRLTVCFRRIRKGGGPPAIAGGFIHRDEGSARGPAARAVSLAMARRQVQAPRQLARRDAFLSEQRRRSCDCSRLGVRQCPGSHVADGTGWAREQGPVGLRLGAPAPFLVATRAGLQRHQPPTGAAEAHIGSGVMPAERHLQRRQVALFGRSDSDRADLTARPPHGRKQARSGRGAHIDEIGFGRRRSAQSSRGPTMGFRSQLSIRADEVREQQLVGGTSVLRPSRLLTVQRSIIAPKNPRCTTPAPRHD